jgi:hypothetical protein
MLQDIQIIILKLSYNYCIRKKHVVTLTMKKCSYGQKGMITYNNNNHFKYKMARKSPDKLH